jgi:histidine ammonia-lyase
MVNGTHATASLLALAAWDANIIMKSIDVIAAMALEALRGRSAAYDLRIHRLRPYPGQIKCVKNINGLTAGSKLLDSRPEIVQDAYAYRCTPQVHGACRSALAYVNDIVNVELNAVTDSPLVFDDGNKLALLSGGNFHAEPLGYAADTLGLTMSGLGTLSERRGYRLTVASLSRGLPSYLIDNPGINSGIMIAQYSAASLASENKVLSHPSTVDSITVAEDQEDHVSMATTAARKVRWIIANVARICAVELMCASQALDFRFREENTDHVMGKGTSAALHAFREIIPFMQEDKILSDDIEAAKDFILSRKLIQAVETALGYELE